MKRLLHILLADDHTILRAGLRLVIEKEPGLAVIAEAADGRTAVQLAAAIQPHLAVIDIAMPELNGIEATRQILAASPKTAIVILSMHSDETYILRALRAGALAYLLKDSAEADLISAIGAVAAGRSFFSPKVTELLRGDHVRKLRSSDREDSFELLSPREREILQLIGEGWANKEIANRLHLSVYTVETHRARILEKLDLHSAAELILYAVRKGIAHV